MQHSNTSESEEARRCWTLLVLCFCRLSLSIKAHVCKCGAQYTHTAHAHTHTHTSWWNLSKFKVLNKDTDQFLLCLSGIQLELHAAQRYSSVLAGRADNVEETTGAQRKQWWRQVLVPQFSVWQICPHYFNLLVCYRFIQAIDFSLGISDWVTQSWMRKSWSPGSGSKCRLKIECFIQCQWVSHSAGRFGELSC